MNIKNNINIQGSVHQSQNMSLADNKHVEAEQKNFNKLNSLTNLIENKATGAAIIGITGLPVNSESVSALVEGDGRHD